MDADSHVLETPRLWLRPTRLEDFDAWARFAADPVATRYLGGPLPRSMAWRSFLAMAGAWQLQGFAMFSVIHKESGRWLGRVGRGIRKAGPGRKSAGGS